MIIFQNFSYKYPEASRWALKKIDLQFTLGEVVVIAGPNGGGKSTLQKAILGIVPHATGGSVSGQVVINGRVVHQHQTAQLAGTIGLVLQDPESQVTNLTVWEEVTFGLANLLTPREELIIRAEQAMIDLGMDQLASQSVLTLSGGQLQRLTLATLLAMRPQAIILDEPVANLDPLGVASVVSALHEIRSFVPLMIICSHWLDPFLELASRVVVIDQGQVKLDIPMSTLDQYQTELPHWGVEIPHQLLLASTNQKQRLQPLAVTPQTYASPLSFTEVWYRYPESDGWSLQKLTHHPQGRRLALVGHNGSGKSTLARLLTGLDQPTQGQLISPKKVGLMLQKPTLSFLCSTVAEELAFGWQPTSQQLNQLLEDFELTEYRHVSPFHLSGGEQRRLVLALAMIHQPEVLILDEPTAGLDARQVKNLLEKVERFTGTVIFITHDTRIVAEDVDELIVLEQGQLIFAGHPRQLDSELIRHLGYDQVNPTVRLALAHLPSGFPMLPSQVIWEES